MSVKNDRICDICGRIIDTTRKRFEFKKYKPLRKLIMITPPNILGERKEKDMDICAPCYGEFVEWIKHKDAEIENKKNRRRDNG